MQLLVTVEEKVFGMYTYPRLITPMLLHVGLSDKIPKRYSEVCAF